MSTDRGWLRGGPARGLTSQNPSFAKGGVRAVIDDLDDHFDDAARSG